MIYIGLVIILAYINFKLVSVDIIIFPVIMQLLFYLSCFEVSLLFAHVLCLRLFDNNVFVDIYELLLCLRLRLPFTGIDSDLVMKRALCAD